MTSDSQILYMYSVQVKRIGLNSFYIEERIEFTDEVIESHLKWLLRYHHLYATKDGNQIIIASPTKWDFIELTVDFPFDISSIIHPEGSFQERVGAASWSSLMKS